MNSFFKLLLAVNFSFFFSCISYNSINLNNTYKSSEIIKEFKKDINRTNKTYSGKTITP